MKSFEEFWPFYLGEHKHALTRNLHFGGTSAALCLAAYGALSGHTGLIPFALVCGYGPAWVGHFFIEKNRPATFKHPLWSFRGDFRMLGMALTGKLTGELQRLGIGR